MDSLAAVVIIALAIHRLGHLLMYEAGPRDMLLWVRSRVGIQHDEDGQPTTWKGNLADGWMCPYCMGIWLAVILTALWIVCPWPVILLAAAGVALALRRLD